MNAGRRRIKEFCVAGNEDIDQRGSGGGGATDISFGLTESTVWPSSTANDQTDTVAFDGWTQLISNSRQLDEDESTVNLLRIQRQNHTTSLGFT